jgi:hypothetical protein
LHHIPNAPSFHNDAVTNHLRNDRFNVEDWLTTMWRDAEDFLAKRSGLIELSRTPSTEKTFWSKKMGLETGQPDENVVHLYNAVVSHRSWPPIICDLSPETTLTPHVFPSQNPNNILTITFTNFGYLVDIRDGVTRPWKLLISDPLTLLQIERENWCSDGDNLVVNLIKKGIPFQILHETTLKSGSFYEHTGPILHPTGKDPRLVDYFAIDTTWSTSYPRILTREPQRSVPVVSSGGYP